MSSHWPIYAMEAHTGGVLVACDPDCKTAVRWDIAGVECSSKHQAEKIRSALQAAYEQGRRSFSYDLRRLINDA